MTLSPGAVAQQALWGSDPLGWATYSEPCNRPLFEAVLDAAGVGAGTHLLDAGCGAGLALAMAVRRGARVTGYDISEGLLGVARTRVPDADLRLAELEAVPYEAASFDAVVGINAFQFAADPRVALHEAARVVRPGGRVVSSLFAEPDRCESTVIHEAMSRLSPPAREAEHQPYALSGPGNLEAALEAAGLVVVGAEEVVCWWAYDDVDACVRALLSSGGGTRAVQDAGRAAVEATVREAVRPFTDPATGEVALRNIFRWVAAARP